MSPHSEARQATSGRSDDAPYAPGEWHEVLGDFYVLPSEYGTGLSRIKLYVTLGSPLATAGRVSLTDLTVTPLPLHRRIHRQQRYRRAASLAPRRPTSLAARPSLPKPLLAVAAAKPQSARK